MGRNDSFHSVDDNWFVISVAVEPLLNDLVSAFAVAVPARWPAAFFVVAASSNASFPIGNSWVDNRLHRLLSHSAVNFYFQTEDLLHRLKKLLVDDMLHVIAVAVDAFWLLVDSDGCVALAWKWNAVAMQ